MPPVPVRLTHDVFSSEGHQLFAELREFEDDLQYHCSCPGGHTCDVVLQEAQVGHYDVIVKRPGFAIVTPEYWATIPTRQDTRYVRSFQSPSPAEIAGAVASLVALPLVGLP